MPEDTPQWVRPTVTIDLEEYMLLKSSGNSNETKQSSVARLALHKLVLNDPFGQNAEILTNICKEHDMEWLRSDSLGRVLIKPKQIKK